MMGSWTALRFIGTLKPEFKDDVSELLLECREGFDAWEEFAEKHPFAKRFSKLQDASSIPFGGFSAYNDDRFCGEGDAHMNRILMDYTFFDDFPKWTWLFQCDLKDYHDEIDAFLSEIAPEICERFIAEIWFEEWGFPEIRSLGLSEQSTMELKAKAFDALVRSEALFADSSGDIRLNCIDCDGRTNCFRKIEGLSDEERSLIAAALSEGID